MISIHRRGFSLKDGIVASFHNTCYLMEEHIHQYSELVYILDGEFTVLSNGKFEIAKKGDVVIIPPYQPHGFSTKQGCTVHIWMLLFSNSLISDMMKSPDSYYHYEQAVFTPSDALKVFIESRMTDTKEKQILLDEAGIRRMRGLLYPVFDEYMSAVTFSSEPKKDDGAAITVTLQYISQHCHENITLSDVCKAIGYSKSHISHILSENLSLSFRSVLNSFRINYARNLLRNTNKKIFDIAIQSGFESECTFHRCFKKMMGLTPTEFKNNYSYREENITKLFNILIRKIEEEMELPTQKNNYSNYEKIRLIKSRIIENPEYNWNIDDLARECKMSKSHFQAAYKQVFGTYIKITK